VLSPLALAACGKGAESQTAKKPSPASAAAPKPADETIKALVERSKQNLVFVEGGEFMMGDFGELDSVEKLPYTAQSYNKPLHKVQLDSFSISKYKVTYEEYDVYTKANNLPLIAQSGGDLAFRKPNVPAGIPWQGAKDYCLWLGKLAGSPFDLPTEAQWEYAARASGKFLVFPTNDGYFREGVNAPSAAKMKAMVGEYTANYPVGMYPLNPLGLFDMATNAMEWVSDWFSEDYYTHSPLRNPTGPASGTKKVMRSWPNGESGGAMTMYRRSELPDLSNRRAKRSYSFRCTVQQTTPVR
jgi:formylglycine-generating enzyme